MINVDVIRQNGSVKRITAAAGANLMETIRAAGIDEMMAICGGCCSCATCHIHVDQTHSSVIPPMSEDERGILESLEHFDATSRLSCQIILTDRLDGLRVVIPADE